jgi:hypothetical protein
MADEQEHKQADLDSKIDSEVDKLLDQSANQDQSEDQEAPSEGSTENAQEEPTQEGESDSQKTQSTDEGSQDEKQDFKGVDKGFASHPKWIERENKLKEAIREKEEALRLRKSYESLLNDPDVFEKYLKRQGLSDYEIRQQMQAKGFPVRGEENMVDKVAKKLGWDISKLDKNQRDYIEDLIRVNQAVAEDVVTQKVRPFEQQSQIQQQREQAKAQLENVKAIAKEDGLDWDKEVAPAMKLALDELEQTDPEGAQNINVNELYFRSTRKLAIEKAIARKNQEQRDVKKGNARPLVPGGASKTPKQKKPIRTDADIDQAVDEFMAGAGY